MVRSEKGKNSQLGVSSISDSHLHVFIKVLQKVNSFLLFVFSIVSVFIANDSYKLSSHIACVSTGYFATLATTSNYKGLHFVVVYWYLLYCYLNFGW